MDTIIGSDIGEAVEYLKTGNVVAIPTETVYGLAGNAMDPNVVEKIFQIKERPKRNPLILHVRSLDAAKNYVNEWPEWADLLTLAFWPGPLTLLLKKSSLVSDLITAGSDRVAIRIPAHPMALELLNRIEFPLAAPSANPFTYISPTTAMHVFKQLSGKIPYILDGGACKRGLESSIVGMEQEELYLYRAGAVNLELIEKLVGALQFKLPINTVLDAPGMLAKHYSPKTKLVLTQNLLKSVEEMSGKKIGLLVLSTTHPSILKYPHVELSKSANLEEAAENLYAGLHILDQMNLDLIIAETLPDEGIGRAINDRLRRAATI